MQPVLFHIYSFDIRSWGLMVIIGIISGTVLVNWLAGKTQIVQQETLMNFIIFSVIAGLIGAWLWEVAFHWQSYRADPIKAFRFWQSGLSLQGGILAGLLVSLWFIKKYKIDFWKFIDILAPGLILGQAIGRIGCFLNGDAFGIPTSSIIGVSYQPGTLAYNTYGSTPLLPAELLEGAGDVAILLILLVLIKRRKPFDGIIALTYFILYSILRFILEYWRGDSLKLFYDLNLAQIVSIVVFLMVLGLFSYRYRKIRN